MTCFLYILTTLVIPEFLNYFYSNHSSQYQVISPHTLDLNIRCNDVEYLCITLLAIYVSSLESCLFKQSIQFLEKVVFYDSILFILNTRHLPDKSNCDIIVHIQNIIY